MLMVDNLYFIDWKMLYRCLKEQVNGDNRYSWVNPVIRSNPINRCFRKFPMLETRVSNWGNFSFKAWNFLFYRLKPLLGLQTEITIECDEDNNCSLHEKNQDGIDSIDTRQVWEQTFALIPATTLATIPETTMNKGIHINY